MRLLSALAMEWRQDADRLEAYNPGAATAFRECAERLEERIEHHQGATLSVAEAAAESGYTEIHMRRLLAEGTIPNAGTPGDPQIRRRDLPRKPGHGIVARTPARPTISNRQEIVRAVLNGGR